MKNKFLLVLIFLLILNFHVQQIPAQEVPGLDDAPLVGEIQKGNEIYQNFSEQQNKTAYLEQEWAKLLEKNKAGKVLLFIGRLLDPFARLVLQVDSILSWAFVYSLILWIALFLLLANTIGEIFGNKWLGVLVSFIVASLVGTSGVIKQFVFFFIPLINSFWAALIGFVIGLAIAFFFGKLGKFFGKFLKRWRKQSEEEETKKAQKTIQAHGKVSKKELDSY
ncbi:MAG: hypothetical protein KJ600_01660 [Nanoarchaeota archaeon]|nr:hypothetical protein [Nanoarchaeota archaeon]MBU1103245.1 hypothetical protein [Nanoarchaeota archaeon]